MESKELVEAQSKSLAHLGAFGEIGAEAEYALANRMVLPDQSSTVEFVYRSTTVGASTSTLYNLHLINQR